MLRTFILALLVVAAAPGAAADQAATAPSSRVAGGNASASAQAVDAAPKASKKPAASKKSSDGRADATAAATPTAQSGDVKMSGMSILGNEDTPKSLALVPWKSSQLGEMPSVSRLLDSSTQPVDKDVFLRELAYYTFKSDSK